MDKKTIQTSRFGSIEIPQNRVIVLEKPILGFENLRTFCLLEHTESEPFLWLQSADDPETAFVIINPALFFPTYRVETHPRELDELGITDIGNVETYVIVTMASQPTDVTANLQGPLIINTENRRAKQLVLVNSVYDVAEPLFAQEKQATHETKQLTPVSA